MVDISLVSTETVMPFPLVTVLPPVVHMAVAELIRPTAVFDTVQARVYVIPALAVPALMRLTEMASGGTKNQPKHFEQHI